MRGDELDYFFTDSGATVVFADAALAEHVTATASGPTLSVRTFEDLVPVAAADGVEPQRDDEFTVVDTDVAQLLYTSGTTSSPKGAIMTHRALIHHYLSCLDVLDFEASDRMVHALPLYHSAQMHVFMLPSLMKGGYNLIVPGPRSGPAVRDLREGADHSLLRRAHRVGRTRQSRRVRCT